MTISESYDGDNNHSDDESDNNHSDDDEWCVV